MLNILTARAEAEDQQDASGQAGQEEEEEEKVEAKEEQGKEDNGGDEEEVHREPGAAQALQQPAELQLRGVQHVRKEVQHQGGERPEDDGTPEEDAQNRSSANSQFCCIFLSFLFSYACNEINL